MRRLFGLLVVCGMMIRPSAAVVIDTFDRPPPGAVVYGPGGQAVSDSVPSGAIAGSALPSFSTFDDVAVTAGLLGASRDMKLEASTVGAKAGTFGSSTANFAGSGVLTQNNNTHVASVLTIQYDNIDTVDVFGGKGKDDVDWESLEHNAVANDPKGTGLDTSIGLGDITKGGATTILALDVTNDDSATGDTVVNVKIYKKGGGATDYVETSWTIKGVGTYARALGLFTSGGGAAPDFTDVGAIVFTSSAPDDADMEYDMLYTVPEPATLAFLGCGVLPFLRRRKRS